MHGCGWQAAGGGGRGGRYQPAGPVTLHLGLWQAPRQLQRRAGRPAASPLAPSRRGRRRRPRDTRIGCALRRGISGGQAKRVNVGVALLTHARVLLLDEPTSGARQRAALRARARQRLRCPATQRPAGARWGGGAAGTGSRCGCLPLPSPPTCAGLDSFTSNEVMELVKSLCQDGTTIAATIREPAGRRAADSRAPAAHRPARGGPALCAVGPRTTPTPLPTSPRSSDSPSSQCFAQLDRGPHPPLSQPPPALQTPPAASALRCSTAPWCSSGAAPSTSAARPRR